MNVFDAFPNAWVDFTYYEVTRGSVIGNTRDTGTAGRGIFVAQQGASLTQFTEALITTSLLYVLPVEPYDSKSILGNQIEIQGQLYNITGWGEGKNQDNGTLEHIELELSEVA